MAPRKIYAASLVVCGLCNPVGTSALSGPSASPTQVEGSAASTTNRQSLLSTNTPTNTPEARLTRAANQFNELYDKLTPTHLHGGVRAYLVINAFVAEFKCKEKTPANQEKCTKIRDAVNAGRAVAEAMVAMLSQKHAKWQCIFDVVCLMVQEALKLSELHQAQIALPALPYITGPPLQKAQAAAASLKGFPSQRLEGFPFITNIDQDSHKLLEALTIVIAVSEKFRLTVWLQELKKHNITKDSKKLGTADARDAAVLVLEATRTVGQEISDKEIAALKALKKADFEKDLAGDAAAAFDKVKTQLSS